MKIKKKKKEKKVPLKYSVKPNVSHLYLVLMPRPRPGGKSPRLAVFPPSVPVHFVPLSAQYFLPRTSCLEISLLGLDPCM